MTQQRLYDVFLSYASDDRLVVEALAGRLRDSGVTPFLDRWHLGPGDPWQEELELALSASCACAVFLGPGGIGPWHNEEMRLALDKQARDASYRLIPVLLPGVEPKSLEVLRGFLGRLSWAELPADTGGEEALHALLRGIMRVTPEPGEIVEVPSLLSQWSSRELEKQRDALEALAEILGTEEREDARQRLAEKERKILEASKIAVRGPGSPRIGNLCETSVGDSEAINSYLRNVSKDCSRLPLGIMDPRFAITVGNEDPSLPDIYVDLEVVAPAGATIESPSTFPAPHPRGDYHWALQLAAGEGEERTSLLELLRATRHRRVVLLGDPGTGKTTFAHYLTYLLATADPRLPEQLRGLIPIRLTLADVAARSISAGTRTGNASLFWSSLKSDLAHCLGDFDLDSVAQSVRERVLRLGGFFLLDGLDEVPGVRQQKNILLQAIQDLADSLDERSVILVTSRPYAYSDPALQLRGFVTLALAPFTAEQIERFLPRFYHAVRPAFQWGAETATGKAKELWGAIKSRNYLGDLATRPLLLTLMATLHASRGTLPDDRADLYNEIVHLLLSRWQRARGSRDTPGMSAIEPGLSQAIQAGEESIRARLEELALSVHERQRSDPDRRNEAADISESEILVAFKPVWGPVAPENLLSYLKYRAGLLIERRTDVYAFPHRSFQEYLAASHLAGRPEATLEILKRLKEDPIWWREVYLLAVGKARQGGLGAAVNLVIPLLKVESKRGNDLAWRLASLAGEAILDLRLLERAGEDLATYEELVLQDLRVRLRTIVVEGFLPPQERLAAGDALGRLGDPTPGKGVVNLAGRPIPDSEWVEIPPGKFWMGSKEDDLSKEANELPARELEIPRFWIGRYPVTNEQFGAFLATGGYDEEELWGSEGWSWRRSEEIVDLDPYSPDLKERLGARLDKRSAKERDRPFYWDDFRRVPTRPVVGVTWYEARAFCAWLDREIRITSWWKNRKDSLQSHSVRLPTEAEWERAARGGKHYRWPWGDAFQQTFNVHPSNTREVGLNQGSPVGIFPAGRNPFGLDDMAGNVWEWTSSRYETYPYNSVDGRENPAGPGRRVLRGGSWFDDEQNARCAYRYGDVPSLFFSDVGFRCALSASGTVVGES